jgi:NADH-quinone oxidoreductase subunit N
MLVGLLSLAGIPGTGGFLAKLLVFGSAIRFNEPQTIALAVVGVITSAIAAYYYLNVVRAMFFESPAEDAPPFKVPLGIKIGLMVAAVAILAVGVFPQPFLDLATQSMQVFVPAF